MLNGHWIRIEQQKDCYQIIIIELMSHKYFLDGNVDLLLFFFFFNTLLFIIMRFLTLEVMNNFLNFW